MISHPRPRADPVTRPTLSSSFIVKPVRIPYTVAASIIRRTDLMQACMPIMTDVKNSTRISETKDSVIEAILFGTADKQVLDRLSFSAKRNSREKTHETCHRWSFVLSIMSAFPSGPKPKASPAWISQHQRRHRNALCHQENWRLQTQRHRRRLPPAARWQSGTPGALVRGNQSHQRRRWHRGTKSALQGRRKRASRDLHADHALQPLCQR